MNLSMNEIEALAKRATRGAGYPWGLAEEAGRATRWLCTHGLDGCGSLAILLEQGFGLDVVSHTPRVQDGNWNCETTLCSLASGVALSDRAATLTAGTVTLQNVSVPLLILPFLAQSAHLTGRTLAISTDEARAITDGRSLVLSGSLPDHAITMIIAPVSEEVMNSARLTRAAPSPSAWQVLDRFSQLTYAPATEESRLLGAGAGLSDND